MIKWSILLIAYYSKFETNISFRTWEPMKTVFIRWQVDFGMIIIVELGTTTFVDQVSSKSLNLLFLLQ